MADEKINTGGGTAVGDDVNTGGGNFTGRDSINTSTTSKTTIFDGNVMVALVAVLVVGIIGVIVVSNNRTTPVPPTDTPTWVLTSYLEKCNGQKVAVGVDYMKAFDTMWPIDEIDFVASFPEQSAQGVPEPNYQVMSPKVTFKDGQEYSPLWQAASPYICLPDGETVTFQIVVNSDDNSINIHALGAFIVTIVNNQNGQLTFDWQPRQYTKITRSGDNAAAFEMVGNDAHYILNASIWGPP